MSTLSSENQAMSEPFKLRFGTGAKKISTQLKQQCIMPKRHGMTKEWQKLADGITLLAVHKIIDAKERNKLRARLAELISQNVRRMTETDVERENFPCDGY